MQPDLEVAPQLEIFDLTSPLEPGLPAHAGDPPVELRLVRSYETDGYEVTHICLGSHSGTHIDAPRHFFPDGPTLDQFPIERLIGPGVVLDCRSSSQTDVPSKIEEQLRLLPLPPAGLALLWTEGVTFPLEAAEVLLNAGAGLVGTDAASLDAEPYPAHRLLLSQGVLIAENLRGLERLGPGRVTCAFLPLAVIGTDGAPIRAVAWR
jgi:arylformamidase